MKEFDYDCLQKKWISQSARHRVGARRAVTLPSDNLSPRELQSRNGPCRIYRLGRPMTLAEFEDMPVDLRRMYLKRLRSRGGREQDVERMLGAGSGCLRQYGVSFDSPDPRAWADFVGKGE